MQQIVFVAILLGYFSIAVELGLMHVPSVASNVAIWSAKESVTDVYSEQFKWIFGLSKLQKIILFFMPLLGLYFVFLLPMLIMLGVEPFNSPTLFKSSTASNVAGLLFILIGRIVTIRAVFLIRKNNTQQNGEFHLHTDNLFSRSRNPTQLGMYLFFIGIVICLPSLWLLLGLMYYIAYMHVKIKMEENFLTNKYGLPYEQYINQTGRYW